MKVQNSNRSIYQRLMTLLLLLSSSIIVVVLSSQEYDYAEDYGDYQQRGDYYGEQDMDGGYYTQEGDVAGDTLYHDYARHQQYKAGGLVGNNNNNNLVRQVLFGVAGWFIGGKIHSRRAVAKVNKEKFAQQKELYKRYIQDVATLQQEIENLKLFIQENAKHQLMEEFLQADVDNDRKVSRAEFEMYKKQYLAKHPEADASQFPRFEDFDPDRNGMVTVDEHESYYRKHGLL